MIKNIEFSAQYMKVAEANIFSNVVVSEVLILISFQPPIKVRLVALSMAEASLVEGECRSYQGMDHSYLLRKKIREIFDVYSNVLECIMYV